MTLIYFAISIVVVLLVAFSNSLTVFDEWVTYVACITSIHAAFSVIILKKVCRQWSSIPMIFLFALFLFNWGQVWLLGFFKNYELFYNWNKISIYPQYIYVNTCVIVVLFISFFTLGAVGKIKKKPTESVSGSYSVQPYGYYSQLRKMGIIILFITLPFNIYENALYIAASVASGYREIFQVKISDFVTVMSWISIAGVVSCLIAFPEKKKLILVLFSILYVIEMASGNRAQSVVAVLTLFCFYNLLYPIKVTKKQIVIYALFGFFALTMLQAIKSYRGAEGKNIGEFVALTQENVLQKNIILQNMEEFGGAIAFPSIMQIYLKETGNYLYGWTYLSSLAGIFPNVTGDVQKITNSGSVIYIVRDHIYGEYQSISCSNVSEAVMNFGIVGIPFFAFVVGWLIGSIYFKVERKKNTLSLLYYVMPTYAFVFWVRNSFQSTVRYIVWAAIIIWLLEKSTRKSI